MKHIRIALAFLLAAFAVPAFAQNRSNFAGISNAFDFAYGINGTAPALVVDSPVISTAGVSTTFIVAYGYTTLGDGTVITPFATNVPITIVDAGGADTAIPTAISCSTPQVLDSCTVTVTFTNAHGKGAKIVSGSGGLQEAAHYRVTQGGGLVALGPDWFAFEGGHSAGLTALVTFKSLATSTYTVLDHSGIAGVFSYAAASGSVYASTTHVLY
jgi:hypothetical protein